MSQGAQLFPSFIASGLAVAIGHYQSQRTPAALAHAVGAVRAGLAEHKLTCMQGQQAPDTRENWYGFPVGGRAFKGFAGRETKGEELGNHLLEWLVKAGIYAADTNGEAESAAAKMLQKLMDKCQFWWARDEYSTKNGDTWTW